MTDMLTSASNVSIKETVDIAFRAGYRRAVHDVFQLLEGIEFDYRVQQALHQLAMQPPPTLKDVPNG